ncbi:hypothetical protein DRQ36_05320 [bacterium]|nr:MAG: hypothetical protein DRQ36_05320 [bacterium]
MPLQIGIFDINGRMVYEMPVVRARHALHLPNGNVVWTPGESPGPGGYIVRINNIESGNSVQQTTKIIYLK